MLFDENYSTKQSSNIKLNRLFATTMIIKLKETDNLYKKVGVSLSQLSILLVCKKKVMSTNRMSFTQII